MKYFLLEIIFLISCSKYLAFNPFEGLLEQLHSCIETINDHDCSTSLPEVFEPEKKGVDTNLPDTKFYLFTKRNPQKAEPLHRCGGKLPPNSDFNPQVDTIVISHGWLDGVCRFAWMREYVAEFFKRGSYNVILTDWTWGNSPDITRAAANTVVVGEQMAFLVNNIMNQTKSNGDKFHFIGHSFGAFIISDAARILLEKYKKCKIRRLTFLDPAGSPLKDHNPKIRLSYKNAKFVDAIHSGAGDSFSDSYGDMTAVGHVDFYPNGGKTQPSCYNYALSSIDNGDIFFGLGSFFSSSLCSHLLSLQLFKVTISPRNDPLIGVKCDNYKAFKSGDCKRCCQNDPYNCAIAGMDAESTFPLKDQPRQPRMYYFDTSDTSPYEENYDFSINKDCSEKKYNYV